MVQTNNQYIIPACVRSVARVALLSFVDLETHPTTWIPAGKRLHNYGKSP